MMAVAGLPFGLTLSVDKMYLNNDYPGQILVARYDMPETFESVIKKALSDKLPKLSAAQAGKRILLLEQNGVAPGFQEFTKAIRTVQSQFPDLANIDEVWLATRLYGKRKGWFGFFQFGLRLIWEKDSLLTFRNQSEARCSYLRASARSR